LDTARWFREDDATILAEEGHTFPTSDAGIEPLLV
jgi:hypothetical protein